MPSSAQWLAKPENQEKLRLSRKKYREANKEKERQYKLDNKENYNRLYREFYQRNKERLIPYINAHRKGRIKDATPTWANKLAIRHFYLNCPEGYHVDHVIPLRGKFVSGLHVLENLQYLPAEENLRKSNKCLT